MGRREDVEGMRGGVCEHAHAQMGACGARACAPPLRTPSRGGAAMGTREALVQSRARRCKRALPRGMGQMAALTGPRIGDDVPRVRVRARVSARP